MVVEAVVPSAYQSGCDYVRRLTQTPLQRLGMG
jgi:hypothetical protein